MKYKGQQVEKSVLYMELTRVLISCFALPFPLAGSHSASFQGCSFDQAWLEKAGIYIFLGSWFSGLHGQVYAPFSNVTLVPRKTYTEDYFLIDIYLPCDMPLLIIPYVYFLNSQYMSLGSTGVFFFFTTPSQETQCGLKIYLYLVSPVKTISLCASPLNQSPCCMTSSPACSWSTYMIAIPFLAWLSEAGPNPKWKYVVRLTCWGDRFLYWKHLVLRIQAFEKSPHCV